MAVLLLFEKSDSLSYAELQETTKLTDDQFPRLAYEVFLFLKDHPELMFNRY
jgi:hypothetical protein